MTPAPGLGRALIVTATLAVVLAGCRSYRNYVDLAGPRYVATPETSPPGQPDTFRVGTFNIEFGQELDSALAVIRSEPTLSQADVLLLQEMDGSGTRRIAQALGMGYVYYPAAHILDSERDFGNAILTRWPVVDDAKVLLPGEAPFGRSRRIATAATLQVGDRLVRVYSVHMGTVVNMGEEAQREQFRAVLADARPYEHVVLGGDLNTSRVDDLARVEGYAWPTEEGPRTLLFGRWDHIFFRGIALPSTEASGTVLEVRGASDHRPVWAVGVLEERSVPTPAGVSG